MTGLLLLITAVFRIFLKHFSAAENSTILLQQKSCNALAKSALNTRRCVSLERNRPDMGNETSGCTENDRQLRGYQPPSIVDECERDWGAKGEGDRGCGGGEGEKG